jgi:cell wall-associated NlpC family hydrolase
MIFITNLAYIPVRTADSDRAEMTSQLLYGEPYEVIQSTDKWIYIKCLNDNYHGWIDKVQHKKSQITDEKPKHSDIQILNHRTSINNQNYSIGSQFENKDLTFEKRDLIQVATDFLNTPYLWGGKSIWGCDCSGFVQSVFKCANIFLPRDAYQQAEIGETINLFEESKALDLAFFDNADGKITHVGIIYEAGKIIHASGWVKIEPLDQEGIYSNSEKKYTHKLRIIKRILK